MKFKWISAEKIYDKMGESPQQIQRMALNWPVWDVHVERDLDLLVGALPRMDRQPNQIIDINYTCQEKAWQSLDNWLVPSQLEAVKASSMDISQKSL